MGEIKIEYEHFGCPKLGATARIKWEMLIHRDYTGGIDDRSPRGVDCINKSECEVGTRTAHGFSFDWSKCAHPRLKK